VSFLLFADLTVDCFWPHVSLPLQAFKLAQLIEANVGIQQLVLESNQLTDVGGKAILRALNTNPELKFFSFNGNKFSQGVSDSLAAAFHVSVAFFFLFSFFAQRGVASFYTQCGVAYISACRDVFIISLLNSVLHSYPHAEVVSFIHKEG
jgi:hypothetical protein